MHNITVHKITFHLAGQTLIPFQLVLRDKLEPGGMTWLNCARPLIHSRQFILSYFKQYPASG